MSSLTAGVSECGSTIELQKPVITRLINAVWDWCSRFSGKNYKLRVPWPLHELQVSGEEAFLLYRDYRRVAMFLSSNFLQHSWVELSIKGYGLN